MERFGNKEFYGGFHGDLTGCLGKPGKFDA